jgi:hypothetical protein
MKIWPFFALIIWIFTAAEMVRGEGNGNMDQAISLPGEVEGWKWDGIEMKYNSKTLSDYIDGAAELFLAFGFQNLTACRYEKANQPPITIELYEMGSSEDAYGVFSFDRQDEAVGIGLGSEFGGGCCGFGRKSFFSVFMQTGEG